MAPRSVTEFRRRTISGIWRVINDVKVRNDLTVIEYNTSYRFIVFVANNRRFKIFEISWNRVCDIFVSNKTL